MRDGNESVLHRNGKSSRTTPGWFSRSERYSIARYGPAWFQTYSRLSGDSIQRNNSVRQTLLFLPEEKKHESSTDSPAFLTGLLIYLASIGGTAHRSIGTSKPTFLHRAFPVSSGHQATSIRENDTRFSNHGGLVGSARIPIAFHFYTA